MRLTHSRLGLRPMSTTTQQRKPRLGATGSKPTASTVQDGSTIPSTGDLGEVATAAAVAGAPAVKAAQAEIEKERQLNKDEKVYIHRMKEKRLDSIGSQSILDKQWADKPLNVIRNPHKLSEVELHRALEKIVEMPEKRLKQMIRHNSGQNYVDEVFMQNLAERVPMFLTATLVNITRTMAASKDAFRDHPIWTVLEEELHKRRNHLDNRQLASVMHAFGMTGNGRKEFYAEMEEVVTDSPIFIETEHLERILAGYALVD